MILAWCPVGDLFFLSRASCQRRETLVEAWLLYFSGLLGLNNLNPAGGNGAWIGQPGVPQFSDLYGWLNLAAALCLVPVALGLVRFLSSQQNRRRVGGGIRTPVR